MIYLVLLFAIVYALFSVCIYLGWFILPADLVRKDFEPKTKVSVLIAFRNEAKNLANLLSSLAKQNYPSSLFDIILINDHSEDESLSVIESFGLENLQVLNLEANEKGKKTAMQKAVQISDAELILSSDADCEIPETWLRTVVNKYEQSQAKLIASPVIFQRKASVFNFFQSLDFFALQVITGGSFALGKPVMCNGANLAFERAAYLEFCLNQQKNELASGDDVFTLFALQKQFQDKVFFLKNLNALVLTQAETNFPSFWEQRKRWASKSAKFGKAWITAVLTFAFIFNLLLLVLLAWGLFDFYIFKLFLLGFGIKFFADALILNSALSFFDRKSLMRFSLLFQIPHMLYTVLLGIASQFTKYEWKGRRY